MSRSINNFFKKSQAVKPPHFMHDNLSFKLQRNADLPSQDYKCRFTFAFTKMAEKTAELCKYNPGPFVQNSEIILCTRLGEISGGYSC